LLIDEVQTGFCRTGKMFGIEHYGLSQISWQWLRDCERFSIECLHRTGGSGGLLQARGPSFDMLEENPVSCAAALANIEFLEKQKLADESLKKGELLKAQFEHLRAKHKLIGEIRGKGLMLGIELVRDDQRRLPIQKAIRLEIFVLRWVCSSD